MNAMPRNVSYVNPQAETILYVRSQGVVQSSGLAEAEAKDLQKDDHVSVSTCEALQKVTKRTANIQVVELEFEGDAVVTAFMPTILTKGCLPPEHKDAPLECKEEPADEDSMDVDENRPGKTSACHEPNNSDSDSPGAMGSGEKWGPSSFSVKSRAIAAT